MLAIQMRCSEDCNANIAFANTLFASYQMLAIHNPKIHFEAANAFAKLSKC
jgi:hypothetical protein